MRVVISIGGSVLAPDLDVQRVGGHASIAEALVWDGCGIGAVVGSGDVARDYIDAVHNLSANEVQLNQISTNVTRANARLLIAAFGSQVDPKVAHDHEDAGSAIRCGDISMMGGVMPGQATNAITAVFAEYINVDLLVYATSVNGIFSADPNNDPDATKFEEIAIAELVDVIGDTEMDIESSASIDPLVAKLIEYTKIHTTVLDGTDPDHITPVVLCGEYAGTGIIPEGGDEPTYWAL